MNLARKLIEAFLTEAALTKGSQRVMADKKLVAELAATIRDDVMTNPSAFPPGSKMTFKKSTDQQLAEWFLESIDKIEAEGYEGVRYSRDGVNNDWIVRKYIAGGHSWEDITGVMNMNLRDWYILKNRNMLNANHTNVPAFKGVRDIGYYMTGHYGDKLEDLRKAAKFAAQDKMAKTVKLVDNDDYRIFTVLNRWGGVVVGRGTQWCTANSNYDGNFFQYANRGMLFQIFPYKEEKNDESGEMELVRNKAEAYQFDAGGPNIKNITDIDPNKEQFKKTYPYVYSDVKAALEANAGKIEEEIAKMAENPMYANDKAFAPVPYVVSDEVTKLHKLVDRGWFTEDTRKRQRAQAEEPAQGNPTIEPAQGEQPALPPPQEPQMESIKELAQKMLEDVTIGHITRQFKPAGTELSDAGMDAEQPYDEGKINQLMQTNGLSWEEAFSTLYGEESQDLEFAEEVVDECPQLDAAKSRLAQALGGNSAMEEDTPLPAPEAGSVDAGAVQAATGGGQMAGGGGGGGGQYPPGTAPSMPESIQQKEVAMEKVDKDVAAMLNSLKKYDKLNESVLGMVTLSMAKPKLVSEEKDFFHNPNVPANKQLKAPPKEVNLDEDNLPDEEELEESGPDKSKVPAFLRKEKGGDWKTSKDDLDKEENKSPTTKKGLEDLKAKKDIKEEADPEVMEWMKRFAKLG
jgi:hypothetical protein